jgi:hypothetical protein
MPFIVTTCADTLFLRSFENVLTLALKASKKTRRRIAKRAACRSSYGLRWCITTPSSIGLCLCIQLRLRDSREPAVDCLITLRRLIGEIISLFCCSAKLGTLHFIPCLLLSIRHRQRPKGPLLTRWMLYCRNWRSRLRWQLRLPLLLVLPLYLPASSLPHGFSLLRRRLRLRRVL